MSHAIAIVNTNNSIFNDTVFYANKCEQSILTFNC